MGCSDTDGSSVSLLQPDRRFCASTSKAEIDIFTRYQQYSLWSTLVHSFDIC